MSEESKVMSNLFFGGIPTEPDIKAIRERYPDTSLRKGQVIDYEDIARIIGCSKNSNRYRAVTNRWRSLVENDSGSIIIGTERGVGFKVLQENEKVDLGHAKLRTAAKSARRSYVVTSRVDAKQLSDDEKDRLLKLQNRSAGFLAALQIRGRLNQEAK